MKILLVEDNADHRELMSLSLTGHDPTWEVEEVASGEEALRRLVEEEPYDLVFLDYSLPGMDGLEVLDEIQRGEVPSQVVMVTGRGDEQVAVEAIKAGASDYVVKSEDYLQRLTVVAQQALGLHQLAVERQRSEEALRESEERFRTMFETAQDIIFIKDLSLRYSHVNPAMERLFKLPTSKLIGLTDEELFGEEMGAHLKQVDSCVLSGEVVVEEHTKHIQGVPITFHVIKVPMLNASGKIMGLCGIARDITKRKRVEEELREKENKLREQAKSLEEVNTALKVLLSHRDEEKERLKESILARIQNLVTPYLERLKHTSLTTEQKAFFDIVELNLSEITSPFATRLSSKYAGFTPREVEVANLVRVGRTNAEIADLLCISENAVSFHRKNIRAKLGLKKQKVNLRSYLKSLAHP